VPTVDPLTKPQPSLELRADKMAVDVVFEEQHVAGIRLSDGSTVQAATVVGSLLRTWPYEDVSAVVHSPYRRSGPRRLLETPPGLGDQSGELGANAES
jgi:hypothetical protein